MTTCHLLAVVICFKSILNTVRMCIHYSFERISSAAALDNTCLNTVYLRVAQGTSV